MVSFPNDDFHKTIPLQLSITSPALRCTEAGCWGGEEYFAASVLNERDGEPGRATRSHEEAYSSSALANHLKRSSLGGFSQLAAIDDGGTRIRLNTGLPPSSSHYDLLPMPTISPSNSRSDVSSYLSRMSHRPALSQYATVLDHCFDSRSFWLTLYFALNMGLTLYNKIVLVSFPFPYTLTAIHALCGSLGGRWLLRQGFYQPKRLRDHDYTVILAFSILYSINIAISNVSLKLVTVPFHQVVRAASPIFIMLLSYHLLDIRFSKHKLVSLIPVIIGVGLATYGDYYFTTWGFFLTLSGTLLAALKTIATHVLQSPSSANKALSCMAKMPQAKRVRRTLRLPPPFPRLSLSIAIPNFPALHLPKLHLHPLDLLTRTSPLALVLCILYAQVSGELDSLRHWQDRAYISSNLAVMVMHGVLLLLNGIIAFALNVVSFEANRRAGALSMSVAANVKQVLTVLCAVSMFQLTITPANAWGISLTLLGGAWYAAVEYREKAGLRT
ncbi:hypothetical protein EW146_g5471 [Bondarzewia mesenterica]|uniref:Sugar phosphate transporter domain-containing protein n=1 Tax=Bondarzewia mesenterica TaxID=1095465 RepID=A0A4S4LRF6_9AGAM|nr:hypothetical protein EW146_g5471 [Bondarzewia mesenterica]